MNNAPKILDPLILLTGYKEGVFPMADSRHGRVSWYTADPRAIIPIDKVKMPKSLKQYLKKVDFEYKIDYAFKNVIWQCSNRTDTWINNVIINSYLELHELGYAHSVETWCDNKLVGGLYGVAIGGAFFGESMFTVTSNASKAAFYHLIEHLKSKGFSLLDTQFINDHTELLGAIEIPLSEYYVLLEKAINSDCSF
jgi:leucyl/phenylalanyl-tRNA--protein transferase